jgi:hypothetical protein
MKDEDDEFENIDSVPRVFCGCFFRIDLLHYLSNFILEVRAIN